MIDEKYFLSPTQIAYVLDLHDVTKGTGFDIKGATFNPSIAHAITSRGGGGCQRCRFSNFIVYGFPQDTPVETLRELVKGNDKP